MPEHSPILSAIQRHAAETPQAVALISAAKERVTYAALYEKIVQAAAFLQSHGLRKGDRIALSARTELDFIYVYFAAHLLDVVDVVVDANANPKKLAYILDLTKPRLAFGFETEVCVSLKYDQIDYGRPLQAVDEQSMSADDTADIVFTTGTTGLPKGVMLSHFNIFSSADNINGFIGNTEHEVEVLGLPLCHSFGLGRLRCTLIKGATMVLVGSFANLKLFFNAMDEFHATGFGMVPAVWAYIRKFSGTRISKFAGQLKYIEIGSAAMPIDSKKELCELFPNTRICMHYGLTEASRSAFMEFHENMDRLNTIGKPVSSKVDIRIFDENGRILPDGEQGEICVKGNMVTKSYYRPEENANAFFGDYFRTGDVDYRDTDGNFYLAGRRKELINVGGKKVSPQEVEDAVCSLGVEDCVCVGMEDPNGILGEVPKVYIVRNGTDMPFDEIRRKLVPLLEDYKIPAAFDWIDEIPKTSSGKKQRLSLRNP
ncbi:MAG: acyl--CoA ligase [Victivallales bacterium]|nr:acyl--CoA ligase [Victivallales bacterium]